MNIVLTGATGFLGRNFLIKLKKTTKKKIIPLGKSNYDLTKYTEVEKMIKKFKPSIIINFAALSGGIGSNKKFGADYFYVNTLICANIYQVASKYRIKEIVSPIGGCSYPAEARSPISENTLWNGYPQIESSGYSIAKKINFTAADVYKKQYGIQTLLPIPGNMYGEFDNYNLESSHVIPALIRKFYEAKINKLKTVEIWGDGTAKRDFVYVGDVCNCILKLLNKKLAYNTPLNISSGKTVSIKKLVGLIKKIIGYKGEVYWNKSKPQGQKKKIFSIKRLKKLNLSCETSLEQGLKRTIRWFKKNYNEKNKILRL